MSFRLPPLNALRLFEAAARHCSFKLAAEELHVTPSAVSHGVHALERWLGVPLFRRERPGLRLTEAGAVYLAPLQAALSTLAAATDQVAARRRAAGAIAVSVAPTFANRWLLPRLPRFAARHPGIVVGIDTSRAKVPLRQGAADLAIRMAAAPEPGGVWHRLVRESLVPVCAPAMAGGPGRKALVALLARWPMIRVTTIAEDWDYWLDVIGLPAPPGRQDIHVDTIQMALEAAIQGVGIALGRKPLIDEDVAAGRLVEVGGPPIPARTSYWLVGPDAGFDRPEVKAFRRWLLDEMPPDAAAGPALAS